VARKCNLGPFFNYTSDLFQIKVSHLYNPFSMEFTHILHIPMVSNANLLDLFKILPLPIHFNFTVNISITPDVGQASLLTIRHSKSIQLTPAQIYTHASTSETPSFAKEVETSLKRSCLGTLYLANAKMNLTARKFKVTEAREKIFELVENTWAIYSIGTINQSTQTRCALPKKTIKLCQIKSGDPVSIYPRCYIQTMDHVILANISEMVEIQVKTIN
jgi:hypothetical protein